MFVLGAVATLIIVTLLVGRGRQWFEKHFTVEAHLKKESSGLIERGMPVQIYAIKAGEVISTEVTRTELKATLRLREDVHISAADLLQVVKGKITEAGVRDNISVAVQYMAAWLGGNGCVPINHLMEDAATAEISRAQVWQWVHHETGVLDEGRNVTYELFKTLLDEELGKIRESLGDEKYNAGNFERAAELMDQITAPDEFATFLTSVAYQDLD